jgi:hypothetical protein
MAHPQSRRNCGRFSPAITCLRDFKRISGGCEHFTPTADPDKCSRRYQIVEFPELRQLNDYEELTAESPELPSRLGNLTAHYDRTGEVFIEKPEFATVVDFQQKLFAYVSRNR